MTKHEFIFSASRKYRIIRHVSFWLLWCVAFDLLFHFPTHVFKGWSDNGSANANLQQLGPFRFFIKTLIINSFLAVILPQIAFVYMLFYWLLPNYFFEKRNTLSRVFALFFLVAGFSFVALTLKQAPVIYNKLSGTNMSFLPLHVLTHVVIIDQLTTLPIIAGFALMIKLIKRWWLKQKEIEQLAREKTKAELQLLKAQIHPHFLFNTLNNIYFFTLTNSIQAPEMIRKLSGMLHYILNECDQPLVSLEKEIRMISDYMALEKIRYGEQMQMTIEIEANYHEKKIAPLLLIPFVENSFKHGASKMITRPWVSLRMTFEGNQLHFTMKNSKPVLSEPVTVKGNIGLKNVKKRLELLYPSKHELNIASDEDSYTAYLSLELYENNLSSPINNQINPITDYVMA